MRRHFFHLFLAALCVCAGFASSEIKPDVANNLLSALAAFAGVVVTVFGIWVAVIFPAMLQGIQDGRDGSGRASLQKYNLLIKSLYASCFTLSATFFVFLVNAYLFSDTGLYRASIASFVWLSFVSIVISLWRAVVSGEWVAGEGINESNWKGLKARLHALSKRVRRNLH
jgi:hypothetical protein